MSFISTGRYGMTNLVQQSGRGARKADICHSIVVVDLQAIGTEVKIQEMSSNSTESIDEEALTRLTSYGLPARGHSRVYGWQQRCTLPGD